ncbi:NIF3-like protein 1 isoform X1 [Actinia tenebrosa]|uniref:NIF3-like protein 1 n=1 Tax=Actinia tenebrosa TaxID=6105 RepID=A0A6P8HLQ2_ACTTE|nr:NIF3-like protein 1 isoform X1 [Actinia tenebrosa]
MSSSSLRNIFLAYSKVIQGCRNLSSSRSYRMDLNAVVAKLESFAPVSLAEQWDNVGLLVEPSGRHTVDSMLLTNDLTEKVLEEAIESEVQMILSYHPPIFIPLKRLTSRSFKERIIVKAIEKRIAIYSPHTAFDAVNGGVNDWLASGLGDGHVTPLFHSMEDSVKGCTCKVVITTTKTLDADNAKDVEMRICCINGIRNLYIDNIPSSSGSCITLCCSNSELPQVIQVIKEKLSSVTYDLIVQPLSKVPIPNTGTGRLCTLFSSLSLGELVGRIKKHLGIEYVRLAISQKESCTASTKVSSIAVCAGSGGSVLKGVKADVLLSGEMSHHEVLEAVSNGCHVILCEHSNTERGFLKIFQKRLNDLLDNEVRIIVSSLDADPLRVL